MGIKGLELGKQRAVGICPLGSTLSKHGGGAATSLFELRVSRGRSQVPYGTEPALPRPQEPPRIPISPHLPPPVQKA